MAISLVDFTFIPCMVLVDFFSTSQRVWASGKARFPIGMEKDIKAMFVSWNSLSGKSLFKLSCVCLSLGKLVNGKHFPVNGEYFPVNGEHFPVNEKHFSVNKKHFPVKEKFGLVSRKVFSLWLCLFSGKWFPGNHFPNFPVYVCH